MFRDFVGKSSVIWFMLLIFCRLCLPAIQIVRCILWSFLEKFPIGKLLHAHYNVAFGIMLLTFFLSFMLFDNIFCMC